MCPGVFSWASMIMVRVGGVKGEGWRWVEPDWASRQSKSIGPN